MFDNYADYMYSLLTAPLKQVKKASNQFYLFFKVVGALYDQTVQDIQRVREESMVATASEIMLQSTGGIGICPVWRMSLWKITGSVWR